MTYLYRMVMYDYSCLDYLILVINVDDLNIEIHSINGIHCDPDFTD